MRNFVLLVFIAFIAVSCSRERTAAPQAQGTPATPSPAAQSAPSSALASGEAGVGSTMPPYNARLIDGGTFDIARERGQVVLLNLWATWCGPCRYEIPALDRLHRKYEAKGFKVIGVSIDEGEPAPVKAFVSAQEMHYPVALDPEGKLANMLQTTVIPTSVLIDRKGKVVWKKYGAIEENEEPLMKAIEAAL
jgi:thiol-disulfide isomerase/thioredoxin